MAGWTSQDLAAIGEAEELKLASKRPDGTLRNPVTMWVVRRGDDFYLRSVNAVRAPVHVPPGCSSYAVSARRRRLSTRVGGTRFTFHTSPSRSSRPITSALASGCRQPNP
jgi:Uncharacterized protein conserved in bacteria (DUF2255)